MYKTAVVLVAFVLSVTVAMPRAEAVTFDSVLNRVSSLISELQALETDLKALAAQEGGTAVSAPVTTATPAVINGANRITQNVSFGETNDDITRIQRLLATDPEIYPDAIISGFFGSKTEAAIGRLQARYNLEAVGVVGPATEALLNLIFATYPDENYPANVLSGTTPTATTATTPSPTRTTVSTPSSNVSSAGAGAVKAIEAEFDRGETRVEIDYRDKTDRIVIVDSEDKDEVIDEIVRRTDISRPEVAALITFEEKDEDDEDSDIDEDEAEEAIEDAEDEIDEAEDEIEEAEEDNEEVDYADETLDDAKDKLDEAEDAFDDEDYDEAFELAEEAEDLAKKAADRIGEEENNNKKGDKDEIEEIEAEVDDGETDVTVKYEDDDDYEFTIDEDKEDEIIEEIADELNIDEDEVEDLIELDFGDIDEIEAIVEDGEARVEVKYESGLERNFTIDEDDDDEIIEELADLLDEDEDDIEDVIDFEFED